jgi:hypothetical protein
MFKAEDLVTWLQGLIDAAKNDESFSVAWFKPTKNDPYSIVGGWMPGFTDSVYHFPCVSKSNPDYAMCVKVIVNEGPYAYCDFETLDMPLNPNGYVHDTCIVLEYDDDLLGLAQYYLKEILFLNKDLDDWEKSMSEIN